VSDAWKKLAVAILVTFGGAALATPGTWRERLLAGAVAVLLSQGGYNMLRVARKPAQVAVKDGE